MILQRLREFRERVANEIIPAFHKEQKVRWFLEIGKDGRFLGLTQTGEKKSELPTVVAPYVKRQGTAPWPFLPVDKADYVLGLAPENEDPERAAKRHASYVSLVNDCVAQVDSAALKAYSAFLAEYVEDARNSNEAKGIRGADLIVPRVGDQVLSELPGLRNYWQELQEEKAADASKMVSECLLCGKTRPIARTHPVELTVGAERATLISANEEAFLSYGLEQSEIAPACLSCAREYGEALRYLLRMHSLKTGKTTWVFWTREPSEFDVRSLLSSPDSEQVARLLRAPQRGRMPEIDSNRFFAMAVSAAMSRMVVRSWLDRSVGDVQKALASYFDHQAIEDRDGNATPHGLFPLAASLVGKRNNRPKIDDLPPQVIPALVEHALTGKALPISMLYMAVQRARADRDFVMTRPRASVIKLVLLSQHRDKEGFMVEKKLTPEHPSPAYQCGRLLATLDAIQRAAVHAKATMVDRFYGSASSAPASVFGVLMRGSQGHLGKLRKTQPGLYHYFDRQLVEITDRLNSFPRMLTMEEQGLFALGFYHQKNRRRQQGELHEGVTSDQSNKEAKA